MVLDTFQQLDRILYSPQHKLEAGSQQSSQSPPSPHSLMQLQQQSPNNELVILSQALNSLFKSTEHLDENALRQVLRALQGISEKAITSGRVITSNPCSSSPRRFTFFFSPLNIY